MLRGNFFEKNKEIRMGGQICPPPVCLGLIEFQNSDPNLLRAQPAKI